MSACVCACSHERASECVAETRRRHERTVDLWTDGWDDLRVRVRSRPTDRSCSCERTGACECVRKRCHARHALGRNAGSAPPRASKFGTVPGSQPWRPSAAAALPSAAVGTAKEVREVNSPGWLRSDFVPRPH